MPQFKNWLYLTQHGMFCRICRQDKPPDYMDRHISSEPHQYSVKHQVSLASGYSVMQAFEPTVIMEHEAIIGGFKCLYWLVKNEMAHHTNYPKLLSLAQLLGCDYFEKLKVDQRNNYQSHRIVDEILEILAQIVELPILQEIRSSQAISLEVEEKTDVSVSRQLDIHVRHLDKDGYVFNHFLDLVTLEDGKADSVVAAIKSVLQKKELPVDRLYGLGTDGAAVMTGRLNGVAKQLTDSFPKLVSVACAAHRLALACKDASNAVKYMANFRNHLQELHLFFRNSANRSATLRSAATTLGLNDLKVKEVKDTRWLSQHLAVQNLQRNLPAMLAALAEEASTRKCPVAKGLYTFCATYRFVAALYLQADVLPHIAMLSKVFQRADVNFLHIKEQVPVTLVTLGRILEAGETPLPGTFLAQLDQDLDNPGGLGAFNIAGEEERIRRGHGVLERPREEIWARFVRDVLKPYICSLESNIERRFQHIEVLGAFSVLGPKAVALNDAVTNISMLHTLTKKFIPGQEATVIQEWTSYKQHFLVGTFKDKTQAEVMQLLAKRDFSTMNRVKTDLRNRLKGEHLAACLRIAVNGPAPEAFPYAEALELFFRKPRRIKCTDKQCHLCQK
ncbi:Zinc finger protein 862 [Dissostichus eleginoides]|uniref:Zinc finger protein 862 n=1 Tax=Dissostichus eleginoides TaxID=100907 RepID=A0AAD9FJ76_DISEL|nr:Zinc finger protein 862 [Dissostichus eleginoides]